MINSNIRAKKLLSRSARTADVSSSSPPPTPLSQVHPPFGTHPNSGVVGRLCKQPVTPHEVECCQILDTSTRVRDENPIFETSERPLEKLFASLAQPLQSATGVIMPQTYSPTAPPNSTTGAEETKIPTAPTDSMPTSKFSAPVNPLSLLDQIFASVAGRANSMPLADGPPAIEADPGRSDRPHEKGTPTTPSPTALNPSAAALLSTDSDHTSAEDYDGDRDEFFFAGESLSSYWSAGRGAGAGNLHPSAHGDVSHRKTEDGEYQELEAPSPSLIPNPLRTPMHPSVIHHIEAHNAATPSHSHVDVDRASNHVLIGHPEKLASLDHLDSMHHSSGLNAMRQHLADSTSIETALDVNTITAALLDSLRSHRSGGAEGMRSAHLSKHDFVSELLALIRVSCLPTGWYIMRLKHCDTSSERAQFYRRPLRTL
jgi:hypothetical protein